MMLKAQPNSTFAGHSSNTCEPGWPKKNRFKWREGEMAKITPTESLVLGSFLKFRSKQTNSWNRVLHLFFILKKHWTNASKCHKKNWSETSTVHLLSQRGFHEMKGGFRVVDAAFATWLERVWPTAAKTNVVTFVSILLSGENNRARTCVQSFWEVV